MKLAPVIALLFCSAIHADTHHGSSGRQVWFGDLHIHTGNSLDAFLFSARTTPDDAYRYARGETITHPAGFPIRLHGAPLDFAAVTDHAQFMGVLPMLTKAGSALSDLPLARQLTSSDRNDTAAAIRTVVSMIRSPGDFPRLADPALTRNAWLETIDAAERFNEPGIFTTFIGYEYSSAPDNQNLHRNVIFRSGKVPSLPFSTLQSSDPEDLWAWMDRLRKEGIEALAIPHNSNVSNGLMFSRTDLAGNPLDRDHAETRMRNEPLVEVSQVKGTSETHPLLSPNDEWAAFELYDYLIATTTSSRKSGGFVREAYRTGLEFEENEGFNPYRFGLVGSTDTHSAGGSLEEKHYSGKLAGRDATPEKRGSVPAPPGQATNPGFSAGVFSRWSAAGLTGVWAEKNTRESLYAAFRRKEVFATSGPRIKVGFFAGFEPEAVSGDSRYTGPAMRKWYPMGSILHARDDKAPDFLVIASADPASAPLQRLQMIKGWMEQGSSKEKVFDIACSDGLSPDPLTWRCPANGASVDPADCQPSADRGNAELRTRWQDPEFSADQRAFYYVRVIENPSCRWSSWDALRAGVPPDPDLPRTIQERAWSSPIWYVPAARQESQRRSRP